jgi:hypothetical protein
LKDGRLDEAARLLDEGSFASRYEGQKLIAELTRALLSRAREHLEAGRYDRARADAESARGLAGETTEIAEVLSEVGKRAGDEQRTGRRRAGRLAAARDELDGGRLSLAEEMLEGLDGDSAAGRLKRQTDRRRQAGAGALQRARAAADRGEFAVCLSYLADAREHRGRSEDVLAATDELTARAIDAADEAFVEGDLVRASLLVEAIESAWAGGDRLARLRRALDECDRALRWLERGHPTRAREALRRAGAISPSARWISQAADQARQAAEAFEALRSGPLGMLQVDEVDSASPRAPRAGEAGSDESVRRDDPTRPLPGAGAPTGVRGELPRRLLLEVDGSPGVLVARGSSVTVGPVSSSALPEVGLMIDPSSPVVTFERSDGEYLLRCGEGVTVNGRPTQEKLLSDGDKIALSRRASVRFAKPNAASGSAVLEVSGGRIAGSDARRVLLMDREIVLGPGGSAHVRTAHLPGQLVLSATGGRLTWRGDQPVTVDHQPLDPSAGLPLGRAVRVGPVGMTVSER